MRDSSDSIRIDQWLAKSCVFKTRSKASDACNSGHVKVNGKTARPSKMVTVGDKLVVYMGTRYRKLTILGISHRNIEKALARKLYEEEVRVLPDAAADILNLMKGAEKRPGLHQKGRPTKRDRRRLQRLRDARH